MGLSALRFSREDYPDLPPEVQPLVDGLFGSLNPWANEVVSALRGGLSWGNFNAVVRDVDFTAPSVWLTPTLLNAWANTDTSTYYAAAYCKDADGWVTLRGNIKSGNFATTAFTLPAGFRPGKSVRFATYQATRPGAIEVQADGDVVPLNLRVKDSDGAVLLDQPQALDPADDLALEPVRFQASDPSPIPPGTPFPLLVNASGVRGKIGGCVVLGCLDLTTRQWAAAPVPRIAWEIGSQGSNQVVRITSATGLCEGRKYRMTLLITASG